MTIGPDIPADGGSRSPQKARHLLQSPQVLLAGACLFLHAIANGHYGIFRDELYYIVCGERPDWGYVDHPAIVPLLAARSHALFGHCLWGFRLLPALVMTATVVATTAFTRLLGGNRMAQWLSGLCVLLAPIFLLQGVLFVSDLFQPLTWLGLSWVLVRLEQTQDERWWLAFGAIAGFSLNTKYLIAFYLVGLAAALMFTPRRKSLSHPWIYAGVLLALLMVLPNVLWQKVHGWPFLEFSQAATSSKNLALSPPAFFVQQLIFTGPAITAVWICGLWECLARSRQLILAPVFAVAWLILFLAFDLSHGKPYYLTAIYPTLIALGAVRIEHWLRRPLVRSGALAAVIVTGAVTMPFGLPILPADVFVHYESVIGLVPSVGERAPSSELPQYYADMFGWSELTDKLAAIYNALPAPDRTRAVFFGSNYGEAAAIDVLGRDKGLPPAISGHNSYYLWGPRGADGSVVITVGGNEERYRELFRSVEIVGQTASKYAMPFESGQPIYVLRGMKTPLGDFWPQVKRYN